MYIKIFKNQIKKCLHLPLWSKVKTNKTDKKHGLSYLMFVYIHKYFIVIDF